MQTTNIFSNSQNPVLAAVLLVVWYVVVVIGGNYYLAPYFPVMSWVKPEDDFSKLQWNTANSHDPVISAAPLKTTSNE